MTGKKILIGSWGSRLNYGYFDSSSSLNRRDNLFLTEVVDFSNFS